MSGAQPPGAVRGRLCQRTDGDPQRGVDWFGAGLGLVHAGVPGDGGDDATHGRAGQPAGAKDGTRAQTVSPALHVLVPDAAHRRHIWTGYEMEPQITQNTQSRPSAPTDAGVPLKPCAWACPGHPRRVPAFACRPRSTQLGLNSVRMIHLIFFTTDYTDLHRGFSLRAQRAKKPSQ